MTVFGIIMIVAGIFIVIVGISYLVNAKSNAADYNKSVGSYVGGGIVSIVVGLVIVGIGLYCSVFNDWDEAGVIYVEGDYSDSYTCASCADPADGGYDKSSGNYYCKGHFEVYKSRFENYQNGSSGFSNQYGTSGTTCAVAGCTNSVASSGDTNCCATHSNNCLECGCYIDGDAVYCMDCIEDALN